MSSARQEVRAGSYIVFTAQPQRTNVLALFEPQIYPNRLTAQGEAERPYDVAGWTLPLQMGVAARVVTSLREQRNEMRLKPVRDEADVRSDLGLAQRTGNASPVASPLKRSVRLGVYQG